MTYLLSSRLVQVILASYCFLELMLDTLLRRREFHYLQAQLILVY